VVDAEWRERYSSWRVRILNVCLAPRKARPKESRLSNSDADVESEALVTIYRSSLIPDCFHDSLTASLPEVSITSLEECAYPVFSLVCISRL
jgi:hypothetical protein